jgi:hypothetical protein
MGILEMIPPIYWRKIRDEVNRYSIDELKDFEDLDLPPGTSRHEMEAERDRRIKAEFEAAVTRIKKNRRAATKTRGADEAITATAPDGTGGTRKAGGDKPNGLRSPDRKRKSLRTD